MNLDKLTSMYRVRTPSEVEKERFIQGDKLVAVKSGSRLLKVVGVGVGVAVVAAVAIGLGVYFGTKNDDSGDVYGSWTPWDAWTACAVTCGGGEQTRNRTCEKAANTDLDCAGSNSSRQSCNTDICLDAYWATWGAWGACDATCGQGIYTRYRGCDRETDGVGQCVGDSREVALCTEADCPVYGTWSTWAGWGSCDVTCGTGQQTRTRSCQKESATDTACVGSASMGQACNQFDCPNCSRTCDYGTLNTPTCDTCICSGTNITVRTQTSNNKPLMDVYAYAASAPTTLLATSDGGGTLTLTTLCVGDEIILTKEGFLEARANLTSTSINATVQQTEFPRMVTSPGSKYRLVGGGAQFCCVASATPAVTYYEWFKDGIYLDDSLYPVQTELTLLNMTTIDSGAYKCRANSPVGAVYSKEATLLVKETAAEFCADAVEDKVVSLPSDCIQSETNSATYNARTCAPTPCRNETSPSEASCSYTAYSCCSPVEYLNVTVKCSGYNLSVSVVQSCACATCTLPLLTVSGVAYGATSNAPLNNGQVYVNGDLETTTSSSGSFSFSISASPDAQILTLKFKDTVNNNFHEMIKHVTIPAASTNNVYMSVKMVEKPDPISIQSNVENTIYGGGQGATNSSAAVAEIVIPPDAFYYDNGTKFSGSVSTVLTYLLPSDLEEYDSVPGTFQFVNSDGEVSQLDTMGVFSLQFYDDSNQELSVSEPIDITMAGSSDGVDPDTGASMQLWGLSESTGMWELLPFVEAKRRRRRSGHVVIGQINTGNFYWRNCDIFWGATRCYLNPYVYEDTTFTSVIEKSTLKLTYLYTKPSWWGRTSARWDTVTYTGPACTNPYCSQSQTYVQLEKITNNENLVLIPKAPESDSSYSVTDSGSAVSIVMGPSDSNFYGSTQSCRLAKADTSKLSFHLPLEEQNTFKFNWFQDGIPGSVEPDDYYEYEAKSWCRTKGESYPEDQQTKACSMKVKIINESPISLDRIQVVVSSGMGNALGNYTGEIIGVRSVVSDTNGYVCVSYRCTTYIDDILDETQVSVYPTVNAGDVECVVSTQNPNLNADDQTGADGMNFVVGADGIEYAGLYEYDHLAFIDKNDDCIAIANRARDKCSRGGQIAVTFVCS